MDTPWKGLAPVEPGREYLTLLSYLPLRAYRKIPLFFRYTAQIHRQLRATPGAIGYTLRAKVFSRRFWTLSVWESDRALMDFVAKVPHGEAMKAIALHMGATKFTRWKTLGSDVPPDWDDAIERMAKDLS
jgi:hypothetical protein